VDDGPLARKRRLALRPRHGLCAGHDPRRAPGTDDRGLGEGPRIDYVLNSILNSDGAEPGGIHFQLNRQGFARGGLIVPASFRDTVVGKPVPLGGWVHIVLRDLRPDSFPADLRKRHRGPRTPLAERRAAQARVVSGRQLAARPEGQDPNPRCVARSTNWRSGAWALPAEEVGRLVEAGRPWLLWNIE
jgi:hypothetical protein